MNRQAVARPAAAERRLDGAVQFCAAQIARRDLLRGAAHSLAGLLGLLLLLVIADHAWPGGLPTRAGRMAAALGAGLAVLAIGGAAVAVRLRRVNPVFAARQLERSIGLTHNSVVNALLLRAAPQPGPALDAVVRRAAVDVGGPHAWRVAGERADRVARLVLAGTCALWCVYALLAPKSVLQSLGRLMGAALPAPTMTRLELLEPAAGQVVYAGEELLLRVRAGGRAPEAVICEIGRAGGDGRAAVGRHVMTREPGPRGAPVWRLTLAPHEVESDLAYACRGGDARISGVIEVQPRPDIVSWHVRIVPPAYTDEAPFEQADPQIDVWVGTQATFTARANVAVRDPVFVFQGEDESRARMSVDAERPERMSATRTLTHGGQFRVEFADRWGRARRPGEWHRVRVRVDRAPVVEITGPASGHAPSDAVDLSATAGIAARAEDDIRVARLEWVLQRAGGAAERTQLVADGEGTAHRRIDAFVGSGSIALGEGERVRAWFEATDNRVLPDGTTAPQTTRSRVLTLVRSGSKVVQRPAEARAAQAAAGDGAPGDGSRPDAGRAETAGAGEATNGGGAGRGGASDDAAGGGEASDGGARSGEASDRGAGNPAQADASPPDAPRMGAGGAGGASDGGAPSADASDDGGERGRGSDGAAGRDGASDAEGGARSGEASDGGAGGDEASDSGAGRGQSTDVGAGSGQSPDGGAGRVEAHGAPADATSDAGARPTGQPGPQDDAEAMRRFAEEHAEELREIAGALRAARESGGTAGAADAAPAESDGQRGEAGGPAERSERSEDGAAGASDGAGRTGDSPDGRAPTDAADRSDRAGDVASADGRRTEHESGAAGASDGGRGTAQDSGGAGTGEGGREADGSRDAGAGRDAEPGAGQQSGQPASPGGADGDGHGDADRGADGGRGESAGRVAQGDGGETAGGSGGGGARPGSEADQPAPDAMVDAPEPAAPGSGPPAPDSAGRAEVVDVLEMLRRRGELPDELVDRLGWPPERAAQFVRALKRAVDRDRASAPPVAVPARVTLDARLGSVEVEPGRALDADARIGPQRVAGVNDGLSGLATPAEQRIAPRLRPLLDAYYRAMADGARLRSRARGAGTEP